MCSDNGDTHQRLSQRKRHPGESLHAYGQSACKDRAMTDLNIKAGDEDFQCLLTPPVSNDAVKWSEDNLLAVSTERGVCILSPCKLPGARQYAVADEETEGDGLIASSLSPLQHDVQYTAKWFSVDAGQQVGGCGPADDIHVRMLELKGPRNRGQSFGQGSWMRCIDWSPQGCSLQNSCLLAAVHEGLATKVRPHYLLQILVSYRRCHGSETSAYAHPSR